MQEFTLDDFSDDKIDKVINTLCLKTWIEVNISYTSDFKSAKILREVVDRICKKVWINSKWRTRLVLILDELNNNAVEYGSKAWETNIFMMSIHKQDSSYIIHSSVSDTGNGSHAKTALEMEKLREMNNNKDFLHHDSIRWRWLFLIISQLVDSIYFEDNVSKGLTVGIRKILPKDSV